MRYLRALVSASTLSLAALVLGGCLGAGEAGSPGPSTRTALLCGAAQTSCAGVCVDPSRDVAHCGACGVACAAGAACVSGRCAAPGDPGAREGAGCAGNLSACATAAKPCDGRDNDDDGLVDEDFGGVAGEACVSDSQRCDTAPRHILAGPRGQLRYEDAALVNQRPGRFAAPGSEAALTLGHRLEVHLAVAVMVTSSTPFSLYSGGCNSLTAVAPRDLGAGRGLYILGPGSYVVATQGAADARVAVAVSWVNVPTQGEAVEVARWASPESLAPLSAGGAPREPGDLLACDVERRTVRVRVVWDADPGLGPNARRVRSSLAAGLRGTAAQTLCASTLQLERGLFALEAGWSWGSDPVTRFTVEASQ